MASRRYGVWVANPISYDAQTPKQDPKTPHIILKFGDGKNSGQADINVKSTDKDTRLVYWVNKNFTHPITKQLANQDLGLWKISSPESSDVALDFQRTQPALVDISAGTLLPSYEQGPNNDILDKLEPMLNQAIDEKAKVYVYGEWYQDADGTSGIHDVHMNQGNAKGYSNAVFSDGSLMVHFNDGHWEAVFLAFASQALPTDDRGDPTASAKPFDQTLASSSSS